jgi:hypothetical protein
MPRWGRGEAEMERLIARGELERVTGADGTPFLDQARKTAATASGLVSTDPYSACVLAYDAARFACVALLGQQGLRATTSGGHYAVEQAVRAQFGDGFRPFGTLRRRRNELEYPHLPSDTATPEEAEQATGTAQQLIAAAGELLPQLAFFGQDQQLPQPSSSSVIEHVTKLGRAGGRQPAANQAGPRRTGGLAWECGADAGEV